MADLDFPTSPSVNDTYSFGGKTWVWTGDYWRLLGSGAINNLVIGNTIPAAGTFTTLSATGNVYGNGYNMTGVSRNQTFSQNYTPTVAIQGDVWINTDTGRQYTYFSDGNSSQWAEMEAQQMYAASNVTIANVSQRVDSFTGDGSTVTFLLTTTPTSANVVTVNYNGATLLHESYDVSGANITFGSAPAAGYKFDVITMVGGDSQSVPAGGGTTQVQFNNNGVFSGSPALTFDMSSNTLVATGNIISTYFIGNGSQLTGLVATAGAAITNGNSNVTVTSNSNVTVGITGTSNVAVFAADGLYVSGNVSSTYFIGNGSQLTGISGGTSNTSIRAQAMTMSMILGS